MTDVYAVALAVAGIVAVIAARLAYDRRVQGSWMVSLLMLCLAAMVLATSWEMSSR